jgi:hypothetical protein
MCQKCSKCKKDKTFEEFNKKRDGSYTKMCSRCLDQKKKSKEKNKCEHGRERSHCKECGGGSICEHGRERSQCKDCGGASICEHGRIRSKCKDCGGASICEHNRLRSTCKDCGGASICVHNRLRSTCKECGGASICEHNRLRSTCKDCDPLGHLSKIVRDRVYSALKNNKELSSKEYLGCDVETLKAHIEEQFKEGMTWDNYGEWHIDHMTPLMYKNPTLEQVCERLHYSNTQPLWASENKAKGNHYDEGVLGDFINNN